MSNQMDSWQLLGPLIAMVGLIRTVMNLGKDVREALDTLGVGRDKAPVAFYELWTLGVLSAVLGGLIWGLVWRKSVGGDGQEPHGWWAATWPVLTLGPAMVALMLLNWKYSLLSWSQHVSRQAAWIAGAIVGAVVFYDFPLWGCRGFREFLLPRNSSAEFFLVFIWSALSVAPAFIVLFAFRAWRHTMRPGLRTIWPTVVRPSGFVVIITSVAVVAFLVAYPDRIKFEQARGVVAALVLRTTIFVSLFVTLHAKAGHGCETR